jgi:hypothetical protein
MIGYGRGGGGGFGGFCYRSSHQQGQDGRGNRGRGGRQQRKTRSQNNNNLISIAAELDIPSDQRRIIVGRGGTTLKWLKEVSGVNIFVPHLQVQNRRGRSTQQEANTDTADGTSSQEQANQHPVRVNSSDGLLSILHAFEEISSLLSKSSDIDADFIPCIVKMKTNNITTPVDGKLFLQRSVAADTSRGRCLFSGTIPSDSTNELLAYSIETIALFDEESIAMLVDNILFSDSSLERVQWYYKETTHRNSNSNNNIETVRRIVFVFGSDRDSTNLFFDALSDAITAAENNAPFS